jgi:hypothetical protein
MATIQFGDNGPRVSLGLETLKDGTFKLTGDVDVPEGTPKKISDAIKNLKRRLGKGITGNYNNLQDAIKSVYDDAGKFAQQASDDAAATTEKLFKENPLLRRNAFAAEVAANRATGAIHEGVAKATQLSGLSDAEFKSVQKAYRAAHKSGNSALANKIHDAATYYDSLKGKRPTSGSSFFNALRTGDVAKISEEIGHTERMQTVRNNIRRDSNAYRDSLAPKQPVEAPKTGGGLRRTVDDFFRSAKNAYMGAPKSAASASAAPAADVAANADEARSFSGTKRPPFLERVKGTFGGLREALGRLFSKAGHEGLDKVEQATARMNEYAAGGADDVAKTADAAAKGGFASSAGKFVGQGLRLANLFAKPLSLLDAAYQARPLIFPNEAGEEELQRQADMRGLTLDQQKLLTGLTAPGLATTAFAGPAGLPLFALNLATNKFMDTDFGRNLVASTVDAVNDFLVPGASVGRNLDKFDALSLKAVQGDQDAIQELKRMTMPDGRSGLRALQESLAASGYKGSSGKLPKSLEAKPAGNQPAAAEGEVLGASAPEFRLRDLVTDQLNKAGVPTDILPRFDSINIGPEQEAQFPSSSLEEFVDRNGEGIVNLSGNRQVLAGRGAFGELSLSDVPLGTDATNMASYTPADISSMPALSNTAVDFSGSDASDSIMRELSPDELRYAMQVADERGANFTQTALELFPHVGKSMDTQSRLNATLQLLTGLQGAQSGGTGAKSNMPINMTDVQGLEGLLRPDLVEKVAAINELPESDRESAQRQFVLEHPKAQQSGDYMQALLNRLSNEGFYSELGKFSVFDTDFPNDMPTLLGALRTDPQTGDLYYGDTAIGDGSNVNTQDLNAYIQQVRQAAANAIDPAKVNLLLDKTAADAVRAGNPSTVDDYMTMDRLARFANTFNK